MAGRLTSLLLALLCVPLPEAQASATLRTETPAAVDPTFAARSCSLAAEVDSALVVRPDTLAAPARKKPFLRRVVDYFGESTRDRTFEKKIDFTFAGGPSYSKNTSLGIGLLAAGLYRIDRTDSVTSPSDISIFANGSISGVYAVGMTGNTIFSKNRQKVDYTLAFSSSPREMWGIGYEDGRDNPARSYTEKRYLVRARYLHQIIPNLFVGASVDFEYTKGISFKEPAYLYGQKPSYTTTGIGVIAEWDSRDFIPNAFRGCYFSLQETLFPKGLGNCGESLWRTTLTADFYTRVWRDGILAFDLYGEYNSRGTPWPMLARMGGTYRMRGYYQGRYADNGMATLQIELRQRIWRRIGCVVWGGAGNVFPSFDRFDWAKTLPNYGVGLRWELKKRMNVRLDFGLGRKTSGFMFNINEAF